MPQGVGYGDIPNPFGDLADLALNPAQNNAPILAQGGTLPSFEQGGFVAPQGPPPPVAGMDTRVKAAAGAPVPMEDVQRELQRFAAEHPEQIAAMREGIQIVIQNGELTPQELSMMVQLATAAIQNPAIWPQLRQFAIQQGIAGEQDIPQEYDPGLVFTVLLAGQAAQTEGPAQPGAQPPQGGTPQATNQPPQAAFSLGGKTGDSKNSDGSIPAVVHEGEFVMTAEAVRRKGTDFFEKINNPEGAKSGKA